MYHVVSGSTGLKVRLAIRYYKAAKVKSAQELVALALSLSAWRVPDCFHFSDGNYNIPFP